MITKPTSIDSKRSFSEAGLFCTKIRLQLGDQNCLRFSLVKRGCE